MIKCIYYNSSVYTPEQRITYVAEAMRRHDVMLTNLNWRQFNEYTCINFYESVLRSSRTRPLTCEVETKKKKPRWLVPATQQSSNNWRPTLQVPHCQLAGSEQNSSPLYRMYAFLLRKTNEPHVILNNDFPNLEANSLRMHSDRLDPSEPDLRWQKLSGAHISDSKSHKRNSKLGDILVYFKPN
jgi:hypothetical protein